MNFGNPDKTENREYLVLESTEFCVHYEILNQREKIHVPNPISSKFTFKLNK